MSSRSSTLVALEHEEEAGEGDRVRMRVRLVDDGTWCGWRSLDDDVDEAARGGDRMGRIARPVAISPIDGMSAAESIPTEDF